MDAGVGSGSGRPEMMGESTAVMLDARRGEEDVSVVAVRGRWVLDAGERW